MKGKLVKQYGDFYLISDKEIENGDEYVKLDNRPRTLLLGTTIASAKVPKLSLENCISIEKGYDIEELAKKSAHTQTLFNDLACYETGFIRGFLASVEILSDKKFSEEDMKNAIQRACNDYNGNIIQSLQQTEWDVVIVTEVVPDLDSRTEVDGQVFSTNKREVVKLDADDCLILKTFKSE